MYGRSTTPFDNNASPQCKDETRPDAHVEILQICERAFPAEHYGFANIYSTFFAIFPTGRCHEINNASPEAFFHDTTVVIGF